MDQEQKVRDLLQPIARDLKKLLPPDWGFIFMAFPFATHGTLLYVGDCNRDDAVQTMREFIAKNTAKEFYTEAGETDADKIFDRWWQKELSRIDPTKLHDQAVVRQLAFDAFMAGMVWSVE
jgi:hypothetical protein